MSPNARGRDLGRVLPWELRHYDRLSQCLRSLTESVLQRQSGPLWDATNANHSVVYDFTRRIRSEYLRLSVETVAFGSASGKQSQYRCGLILYFGRNSWHFQVGSSVNNRRHVASRAAEFGAIAFGSNAKEAFDRPAGRRIVIRNSGGSGNSGRPSRR